MTKYRNENTREKNLIDYYRSVFRGGGAARRRVNLLTRHPAVHITVVFLIRYLVNDYGCSWYRVSGIWLRSSLLPGIWYMITVVSPKHSRTPSQLTAALRCALNNIWQYVFFFFAQTLRSVRAVFRFGRAQQLTMTFDERSRRQEEKKKVNYVNYQFEFEKGGLR